MTIGIIRLLDSRGKDTVAPGFVESAEQALLWCEAHLNESACHLYIPTATRADDSFLFDGEQWSLERKAARQWLQAAEAVGQ